MADKKFPLSIVLQTVDKATAGINAVNKRLDAITKPTRDLGKALSDLGDKSGFNAVAAGFSGVGSAVMGLVGKVALVGGVITTAVAGVLSLVDHFDALGDKAEQLGTTPDFLAAIRFAAERAGASTEALDQSLQTLVTNMGAAKAGTGKMLKFLQQISPVLAKQVTSANSLEEALGLLADAAAKLPDAARRNKLAAATLGDPALAPLLARGAAGVQELLTEFHGLAGAQGEAAEAAGKTDDALKRMHAATDGVKAALVTGLAPALTEIIGKMTAWLVGHRADIEKWAKEIGEKLPGAVDRLVSAVSGAVDDVTGFIGDIGGWKVAALGLAAVMTGPLVASILSVSATLLATPFGWVLLSIGAITLAIIELVKHWKELRSVQGIQDAVQSVVTDPNVLNRAFKDGRFMTTDEIEAAQAARRASRDVALPEAGLPFSKEMLDAVVRGSQNPATAKIDINITGAPKGTRSTIDPSSTANVDLTTGHQLGGSW